MPNTDVFELFINRLPDAYYKEPDGNLAKVFELLTDDIQDNYNAYDEMISVMNIDNASGVILDYIGADLQQRRGNLNDNIYRYLIRAKIKRTQATGTCDDIINFTAFILQMNAKDVTLTELEDSGQPMKMSVIVPAREIIKTGLTVRQFGTLLDLLAAGGVQVLSLFEGTFEFGSVGDPLDNTKGFADIDQQTGGELGYAYDPANDYDLPI